MDAEPPNIVVEGTASCATAPAVEGMFRQTLSRAKAPAPGWLVSMRVEPTKNHALTAHGLIQDADAHTVAQRVLSGMSCSALAEALGVWASLVLDAELERAQQVKAVPPVPVPPSLPAASPTDQPDVAVSPTRTPAESEGPEVALGAFVLAETNGAGFAGATPSLMVNIGNGVYLRPALLLGLSLPQGTTTGQWLAGRMDVCTRWPGLYSNGYGLQFDLCGGADIGFTHDDEDGVNAYVSLGPSADLRAEIGDHLLTVLRGVADANLYPGGWSGRFEVAISWRTQ